MNKLCEARLRSNPRFRLVSFDRLTSAERRVYKLLCDEPEFYGLLKPPTSSSLPARSLSRDAALLFLTLREPASAPHLLASMFGAKVEDRVRQLVLDGIFEVEQDGQFISGPSALSLVSNYTGEFPGRIAQLSRDAINYVTACKGVNVPTTAARLYMFNRAPSTPRLQRQFAYHEQLLAYLIGDSGVSEQL